MSKPANPFAIGAFLVGALILLIIGVLVFGGGQFLKKKMQYVIFFDSALNGLNVGAPVKLQGVQIGTVKEISLELAQDARKITKPVVIEIDPEAVLDSTGHPFHAADSLEERKKSAQQFIDAGLKAQLQTQSLLTGLLYVEFSFYRNTPVKLIGTNYKGLPELPAVPSAVDQIKDAAEEVLTNIKQLPIEQIVNDFAVTLKELRTMATSEELKKDRATLSKTLKETSVLIENLNRDLTPLVANLNGTMTDTRFMVNQFSQDIKPILISTEKTLGAATSVLLESKHAVGAVEALAAPDAPLWQSLEALRDAAQSTKQLTDYLERHPDSIIYGKGKE
ncbi:MAG: MlaD family protein [Methylococcales bacterium]|nr:MlaD family protein [Methylococcales bacterium]